MKKTLLAMVAMMATGSAAMAQNGITEIADPDALGLEGTCMSPNRVDVGDYSPSTSHCTVRTGLVYGATYI